LMDEVGLSSRSSQMNSGYGHSHPNSRPMSQAGNSQYNNYMTGMNGTDNGMTPVRTSPSDSYGYQTHGMSGYQGQQQGYGAMPFQQQMTPQAQFQSYNTPGPRNNSAFVSNGFSGYNTLPSTVDFRMQNQSVSPVPYQAHMSPLMNNAQYGQSYNQQGVQGNMYGYGSNGAQQQMYGYSPQMQQVHTGGRGRRVCF